MDNAIKAGNKQLNSLYNKPNRSPGEMNTYSCCNTVKDMWAVQKPCVYVYVRTVRYTLNCRVPFIYTWQTILFFKDN
jgi:hypothetical protein